MSSIIHKKGMPLGWVSAQGKTFPAFICSITGKAIEPDNPGTLYWDPKSGEMIVLSDEGENEARNLPGSEFNPTELDLLSYYLLQNTVGLQKKELMQKVERDQST